MTSPMLLGTDPESHVIKFIGKPHQKEFITIAMGVLNLKCDFQHVNVDVIRCPHTVKKEKKKVHPPSVVCFYLSGLK